MAGLTLDTGALIAAERSDRRFWAFWKEAERRDVEVTVPTTVVAAWRGSRNVRMTQLLLACVVEDLDHPLARDVGALCARARTSDIVDASVIVSAARRRDDVLTGDPSDLGALADALGGVGRILDLTLPS